MAPLLVVIGFPVILVLRMAGVTYRDELFLIVPVAIFGLAALLQWWARRREGYGTSSLSEQLELVARDLRAHADGLEYAERSGGNPRPFSDHIADLIEDVRQVSLSRGKPQLANFDIHRATPFALRDQAARLEAAAKEFRAAPAPYAMQGRELFGCAAVLAVMALAGAFLMTIHRLAGSIVLGIAALGFMLMLYMQLQKA